VKLDFSNAFNTLRRDSMLEAVAVSLPHLMPFALSSYAEPSILWLGENTISSEEGVQQGDPLGPLFFCVTIQPLLANSGCEFVAGYLDDIGLGDDVSKLGTNIRALEAKARLIGLSLNYSKCEVLGNDCSDQLIWSSLSLSFTHTKPEDAVFLGSPRSAA